MVDRISGIDDSHTALGTCLLRIPARPSHQYVLNEFLFFNGSVVSSRAQSKSEVHDMCSGVGQNSSSI